jgi:long-chain fatty acid transport protein
MVQGRTDEMIKWMVALLSLAICGLSSERAFAGGFQINEHSATAMGRADSTVATTNDASSIFYNPAGLTQTEGTQFEAGVTFINPKASYSGIGVPSANASCGTPSGCATVTQDTNVGFVPAPNAYVTRALSSKAFVGFGFYAPYGLKLSYTNPDQFVGRTVLQETDLKTFFLTPAIALKLSDIVSVAVGVSLVPATVYIKRVLGAVDNNQVLFPATVYGSEGKIELSASAFGVGANAGLQLSFDRLKVGFAFRSAVDLAFTGKVHFTLPNGLPAEVKKSFPDGDGDSDITLPHSFALGVGWVDGPLTVEASTQLTLWQSFDQLRINFASGLPQPALITPRNWKTSPLVRVGGQYLIDALALRAGVGYDFTPVPDSTIDPVLPDASRFIFTAGVGYDFGPVRADVSYMGLLLQTRNIGVNQSANFPAGTWNGSVVSLIAVSVGAKI